MNEKIRQLKEIIDGTDNLVFFGGAGVSTESGIPDFRSTDGLYSMKYDYPPEKYEFAISTVISQCELWTDNTEVFQDNKKIINYSLQPEQKLGMVAESPAHYGE